MSIEEEMTHQSEHIEDTKPVNTHNVSFVFSKNVFCHITKLTKTHFFPAVLFNFHGETRKVLAAALGPGQNENVVIRVLKNHLFVFPNDIYRAK